MFKKFKYLNTVCVIMIFSILALALAIGFIALGALKNESAGEDPLEGFKGEYKVEDSESSDSDSESTDISSESEDTASSDEGSESDEDTVSDELPDNNFENEDN